MSNLSKEYSGVVLNQNQRPLSGDRLSVGATWYYQDLFLPGDYSRGADSSEIVTPEISGLQVLVSVAEGFASTASLDWKIEYNLFSNGWISLGEGTTLAAHDEGDKVWMDLFFDNPIAITPTIREQRIRFGIRGRNAVDAPINVPVENTGSSVNVDGVIHEVRLAPDVPYAIIQNGVPAILEHDTTEDQTLYSVQQGVTHVWYSSPNPYAPQFAKAYGNDEVSIDDGGDVSLCFRILGLVADSGTDFLGNSYRSAILNSTVDNTSRIDGSSDASWLSKPNPSRFAVESLYYDVRPRQDKPTYGVMNWIVDPSFEGDGSTWNLTTTGGSTAVIDDEWANRGVKSVNAAVVSNQAVNVYPNGPDLAGSTSGWKVKAGDWIGLGTTVRVDTVGVNSSVFPGLYFYDAAGAFISDEIDQFASTVGVHRLTVKAQAPANAAIVLPAVLGISGSTAINFNIDSIFTGKLAATDLVPDFDGNTPGYQWIGAINNSASVKVNTITVNDDVKVIDHILVDPETPGVYFNVYYATEGEPGATDADWENKLWTHVPATFHATERKSHTLPEPILAKYIKVEFSHLQAKSYSPGDFAKPIKYKKHPKWVLDYFLARLEADNSLTKKLNGRVAVIHDAIDLAFNYYLDDLRTEPERPAELDGRFTLVRNFLSEREDLSDQVDIITLDKINLSLRPYKTHPVLFSDNDYLLGKYAQGAASNSYPVEVSNATVQYGDVLELRSQSVIFESDFPVMSFYITCRHKYREITAEFSHDRAYFVGIKEIAFTRERYTSVFDSKLYQEPAGDLINTERNDFVYEDGVMVIK